MPVFSSLSTVSKIAVFSVGVMGITMNDHTSMANTPIRIKVTAGNSGSSVALARIEHLMPSYEQLLAAAANSKPPGYLNDAPDEFPF